MIIIDVDTLLYRVGFSKPPSASSAVTQLERYIQDIVYRVGQSDRVLVGTQVMLCLTRSVPAGRYRAINYTRNIEYKGHRSTAAKPLFMDEMFDSIVSRDKGYYRYGYDVLIVNSDVGEADDTCSILANETKNASTHTPYCVVGVDKDLDQISGWHFNYVTNKYYYVSEYEADKFFFEQLLTGDVADNIPGIHRIGPKTAKKLLAHGKNAEEWWDIVLDTYLKTYNTVSSDSISETLYERGNMLWIRRKNGEEWYPPYPGYGENDAPF